MKIHSVFSWGAAAAVVLATVSIASSSWYKNKIVSLDEKQGLVRVVTRNVSGLLAMEQDAVQHDSPRVARQWRAVHAELLHTLQLLDQQLDQTDGVKSSVAAMVSVVVSLPEQFEAIVGTTANSDADIERERKETLIDHLTIETRRISDDAYALGESLELRRIAARNAYLNAQLGFIGLFVLFGLSGAWFVRRRVLQPVVALSDMARRVQAGDMDARIPVGSLDEMGMLARTFNETTAVLQENQRSLVHSQSETATFYNTLNAHSIVSMADRHGIITGVNDAFCRISGYSREELLGQDHRIVNSGVQSDAFWTEFWEALHSGRPWRGDICNRARDGSLYWVDSMVIPTHDALGQIEKYLSIRNDITERKEAKAALREANHNLERRVAERTLELSAALQSAQAANRSRAEFLANTSHEIRTPMNSVLGMAYLALQTTADPQQRTYLTKIQRSGAHLMHIIDDILDISKIDAGKLLLETASFELDSLLDHVLHLSEDRASEKNLGLRLERGPEIPRFLQGDGMRVKQIMLNFVSNAIKFTEQGGVVLRLQSLPCEPQCVLLRFEVTDSGIGLTEAEIARLFKPFEQADNSITRKFGGTGLGLAICKQLAQLMGGDVGVNSTPGQGSTFWFQAQFGMAEQASLVVDNSLAVKDAVLALAGRSILVVDDNEFNLDVAHGLLAGLGCQVSTAGNGEQALALLRAGTYAGVLMDVQMPVMDGLEATRQIRADAALADTIVIAMTANASGADSALCLQAGMNDVIRKPVEPELLFITLAKWLGRAGHGVMEPPAPVADAAPAAPLEKQPQEDALPLWDHLALQKIVGDNPQIQSRLLAKYLATAEATMQEILQAIQRQEWAQAAALGHKLKSSSRSVGAMQLGALCESLELAGVTWQAATYAQYGSRMQVAFEEVAECIRAPQ